MSFIANIFIFNSQGIEHKIELIKFKMQIACTGTTID